MAHDLRGLLTDFIGYVSTHPDLHVISTEGLLHTQPQKAKEIVDQYLAQCEDVEKRYLRDKVHLAWPPYGSS